MEIGIIYDAKSIKIKGSPSPEESDEIIDLIKERYLLKILLGKSSRYLNLKECKKKVHSAINDNFEEIAGLIK